MSTVVKPHFNVKFIAFLLIVIVTSTFLYIYNKEKVDTYYSYYKKLLFKQDQVVKDFYLVASVDKNGEIISHRFLDTYESAALNKSEFKTTLKIKDPSTGQLMSPISSFKEVKRIEPIKRDGSISVSNSNQQEVENSTVVFKVAIPAGSKELTVVDEQKTDPIKIAFSASSKDSNSTKGKDKVVAFSADEVTYEYLYQNTGGRKQSNAYDIVIIGAGYEHSAAETKYYKDFSNQMGTLLQEGSFFRDHKDKFNVIRVNNNYTVHELGCNRTDVVCSNAVKLNQIVKDTKADLVFIITNFPESGVSGCIAYGRTSVNAASVHCRVDYDLRGPLAGSGVIHEIGHSLGGLADEYVFNSNPAPPGTNMLNCKSSCDMFDPKYRGDRCYEGCTYASNIFKVTRGTIMGDAYVAGGIGNEFDKLGMDAMYAGLLNFVTPTGSPDTISPTISFITPMDGQEVLSSTSRIEVEADDNIKVSFVKLKITKPNGTVTETTLADAPYSFAVDLREYIGQSIFVEATVKDSSNNESSTVGSAKIVDAYTDLIPPTVEFTDPINNQNLPNRVFYFKVNAKDNLAISYVSFYIDSETDTTQEIPRVLNSTAYSSPYIGLIDLSSLYVGSSHTIYAYAYDEYNNKSAIASVSFKVVEYVEEIPNIPDNTPVGDEVIDIDCTGFSAATTNFGTRWQSFFPKNNGRLSKITIRTWDAKGTTDLNIFKKDQLIATVQNVSMPQFTKVTIDIPSQPIVYKDNEYRWEINPSQGGLVAAGIANFCLNNPNGKTDYYRVFAPITRSYDFATYIRPFTAMPNASSEITDPVNGSIFSSNSQSFSWTNGANIYGYLLTVGSQGPGSSDIFSKEFASTIKSAVVSDLPVNGSQVYVRLVSKFVNGASSSKDYVYTSYNNPINSGAELTSPADGSNINFPLTFNWSAGTNVQTYRIYIGTKSAMADIYDSSYSNSTLSKTINLSDLTKIPDAGSDVYVNIRTYHNSGQSYTEKVYVFKYQPPVTNQPAAITSPTNGSTITFPLTFNWSAGTNVQTYRIYIGTKSAVADIYDSSYSNSTLSKTINLSDLTKIPDAGSDVYVNIRTYHNSGQSYTEKVYIFKYGSITPPITPTPTPGPNNKAGEITSPANGSEISNAQLFMWNSGVNVKEYRLMIGPQGEGASDIHNQVYSASTNQAAVGNIPATGINIYVTLRTSYTNNNFEDKYYTYKSVLDQPSDCPNGVNDAVLEVIQPISGQTVSDTVDFKFSVKCRMGKVVIPYIQINGGPTLSLNYRSEGSNSTSIYGGTKQVSAGSNTVVFKALITDKNGNNMSDIQGSYMVQKTLTSAININSVPGSVQGTSNSIFKRFFSNPIKTLLEIL